ncbi:MAG: DUF2779 domain-containing protein [Bacteroidota bacterium]
MRSISKSGFIRGVKCQKSLYLHYNQPEDRDEPDEGRQNLFNSGHDVGRLAQQLFPGGIDASRGEPANYTENIAFTAELIQDGCPVIYEAAFGDGETLCYLDILVKEGDQWQAYEVKAATRIKEYHLQDASFQYFVMKSSGLAVKDFSMIHLNNRYIRQGALDLSSLFHIEPVTRTIMRRQKAVAENLASLQQMLAAGTIPGITMGPQCYRSYPCDFIEFCLKDHIAAESPGDPFPANRNQDELDAFRDKLEYPLYFMDFETFMPAVPLYENTRPYQKLAFQYSLHVVDTPGGTLRHYEFLSTPPADPRPAFIVSLLGRLGNRGSILVWNQSFEKTILREVGRDFPEFQPGIFPLFTRVADLMVPFRRKYLYTTEMNGSHSLKAVLPAIVPELSYASLGISDGGAACMAYEALFTEPDPEVLRSIRRDLLEYCKLDTLSMVRILEKI